MYNYTFIIYLFFCQVAWWIEFTQFNCGEVGCPEFEPQPLHIIYNIPSNWDKLTGYV